ncbi:MAG: SLBB domain-containing protein, partial [Vicinamibacterales bacterium]|nr:SLBB domain-containing protein [Vicinamibacterales bacterium]
IVKQINSRKAFITGEVGKPGTYQLAGPTTVLQLIAMAGGLTPFAKQERIVIMRSSPAGPVVLRFDYKRVSKMQGLGANVILLPGDTVLVP